MSLGCAWLRGTLEADVFVEPDTPVDLVLFVDRELFAEEVVALLVDLLVVRLVGARIYGAEFPVPDLLQR